MSRSLQFGGLPPPRAPSWADVLLVPLVAGALPPVRKSVVVPLDQQGAFDLFINRLPEWWPLATRSVGGENAASCHVEAVLGGRLYERSRAGAESLWGHFRLLEQPARARGLFDSEAGWTGVLRRLLTLATGGDDLPPVEGPGCLDTLRS